MTETGPREAPPEPSDPDRTAPSSDATSPQESSSVPARRAPRSRTRRSVYAILGVVVVSAVVILTAVPSLFPPASATSAPGSAAVPADTEDCNSHASTAPSALYINQGEPTQNLSAGGTIWGYLEFQVVNYTSADNAIQLWFPSTDFTFPLVSGSYTFALSPQFVAINGSGWIAPTSLSKSEVVSHALDFIHLGVSRLSTQKVAIMATTPYGGITVEFQWHWSIEQPGSTTVDSHAWSTPSYSSGTGGDLPSIFFPAPYVSYLSKTPTSAFIGNNFTATLGGDVSGRYFFLELENATGKVQQSVSEIAPSGATTFNVTIVYLNYDHYLVPGPYLVHIHDICGAILYNKSIKLTFIPLATVTFYLTPASCGSISFGGGSFSNGQSGTFVPSTTAYNFSNPACHGYTFSNWSTTGALHIATGHTMDVSGNGTFSVNYKPT